MKFAAFALLGFAALAHADDAVPDLPNGFEEQCCSEAFGGSVPFVYPAGEDPATWMTYTMHRVAGKLSPRCLAFPAVGFEAEACVSLKDVCELWSFETADGGDQDTLGSGGQTGVVRSGSTGLLCCPKNKPGCLIGIKDNPWTCAAHLEWGKTDLPSPQATAKGIYCGRTDDCKDDDSGCVVGDPHFQLWNGEWYDFHGECDMKFMEHKEFALGLGLEIQIRTKARYEYSFVEAAAVRIGDSVLEVSAYGEYFYNGVEGADLKGAKMMDIYEIEHRVIDSQHHIYNIYTGVESRGEDEIIQIKTFKDLVAVKMIKAHSLSIGKSVGMMGDFDGKMLARDGKTIVSDPIEFGMEWQVKSGEKSLFQAPSPVDGKCVMPSKNASAERRRLGETVPLEAAVAACEAVDHVHHENCVYDVMATGDLEIVHAGVF